MALLAGQLRGAGVGGNQHQAVVEHGLGDAEQHVGKDRPGDDLDPVAVHHLVGELTGDIGLGLVIAEDHFDLDAAQHAAALLEAEIEGVANLRAKHPFRPRKTGDQADLEWLLRQRAACKSRDEGCDKRARTR